VAVTRLEVTPGGDAERAYPIFVDPDEAAEERLAERLREHAPGARIGVITDENVARLHLPRLRPELERAGAFAFEVVPPGEATKSLGVAERLCDRFAGELDRTGLVVALGGGMVGDLAGFVAAILLRGVRYVQVPTTLLSQVDSSVGGKTGVNLRAGKNLVGAFHHPVLVYADIGTLRTLSDRERASGMAEVVKHAVIADPGLLELIEAKAADARAGEPQLTAELVARSVRVKAQVVAADERETSSAPDGGRARLNFGHTVGHALETAAAGTDHPLTHGEAVALGMLAAARVGAATGAGEVTLETRLRELYPRLGLPVDLDGWLERWREPAGPGNAPGRPTPIEALIGVDKKREAGAVRFIVVDRIGSTRVVRLDGPRLREILLGEKRR
jgi:3-dehydroquinate synthase